MTYEAIKEMDPQRFKDLEYTMKLIFNHDDDSIANHNHSLKLLQASHVTPEVAAGGITGQAVTS